MNASSFLGIAAAVFVATTAAAQDTTYEYPFAKGLVEKVDSATKKITVNTTAGSHIFIVTDRSYLFRGKEKVTVDNLKPGDTIKMNYFTNETSQAFVRRLKIDPAQP